MSASLDLQSELFTATGGTAADGVSNQLGRPRADRFTLLVREAVQNSWDAKLDTVSSVRFQIDGYELGENARRVLADEVFVSTPAVIDLPTHLRADKPFYVLAVSDFGTRGLGGPTRGDVVPRLGELTNFVDFMRYIGRPPNRAYAGGTYGFGKAAYYLASTLKTICVYTRFHSDQGIQARFMAAALGPQFETSGDSGRRFTGRHWWGKLAQDGVVDPITGAQADELARLLGGIDRGPDETGTTVYVLAPDFQGASPESVLSDMSRVLADYFWPKLVDGPGQTASMAFRVKWQGTDLHPPEAKNEPELALLTRAFLAVAAKESTGGAKIEVISAQRPRKVLGHVALIRQPTLGTYDAHRFDSDEAGPYAQRRQLKRPLHHIAVMRAPNFVVKYLEGPPVPYELAEYVGVFRVEADVDAAFARSEPPTHDDWVPDFLLDSIEKTYVRVAQRRLKEAIEAFAAPHVIETTAAGAHSVAAFSRLLGGLVPSSKSEEYTSRQPPRPAGTKRAREETRGDLNSQVTFLGEPTIEIVDGRPAMSACFAVSGPAGQTVCIVANPKVVVADGYEKSPPEGSEQPRVLKWLTPERDLIATETTECAVPTNVAGWFVVVSIPPDAMVSLSLKAERRRP